MMFGMTLGVAIAALIMFLLLSWVMIREKGLIAYFEQAAEAFIWLDPPLAEQAALAAAKEATKSQRDRMAAYLTRLDGNLAGNGAVPAEVRERLCRLAGEVESKDWSVAEGREAVRQLEEADRDYANALRKRDPSVLEARHGDAVRTARAAALGE